MKHCKMYYAGYKHLTCDRNTHQHRLLNLQTNEVELWCPIPSDIKIGIPYKNTFLKFQEMEDER
jgi:hypothetical protein